MASLHRRGDSWSVRAWANGHRIRKSFQGEDAEAAALRFKEALEKAQHRGTRRTPLRTPTFAEFAREALDLAAPELSANGLAHYGYCLKALAVFFGPLPLHKITLKLARAYRLQRVQKVSAGTVNHEMEFLRWVIRRAVADRVLCEDPLAELKRLKYRKRRSRALTRAELGKLLAECGPDLKDAVLTMYHTALRHRELTGLAWDDIDWEGRRLRIRHAKTGASERGGEMQTVPVSDAVYLILERRQATRNGSDLIFPTATGKQDENLRRKIQRAAENAGLGHMTVHDLRHTALTHLGERFPLSIVQKIARHSDPRMTAKYVHPSAESERAAVNALSVTI